MEGVAAWMQKARTGRRGTYREPEDLLHEFADGCQSTESRTLVTTL
jgi:hypothetical protein